MSGKPLEGLDSAADRTGIPLAKEVHGIPRLAVIPEILEIILEHVFTFVQDEFDKDGKVLGRMKATGAVPSFLPRLHKKGIKLEKLTRGTSLD